VGMGAVYTSTSDGSNLRDLNFVSDEWREQLLNEYYYTHHSAFTEAVESALDADSGVLVIDCHSFPSKPLPYEFDQPGDRPEICIGTDDFHTSQELVDTMLTSFSDLGYNVKVNTPFAGTIVPSKFYQSDCRVSSIMIEVNRSLYMDELTADKISSFTEHKNNISKVIAAVKQYV
jgi:N-formylglutamate deformylase